METVARLVEWVVTQPRVVVWRAVDAVAWRQKPYPSGGPSWWTETMRDAWATTIDVDSVSPLPDDAHPALSAAWWVARASWTTAHWSRVMGDRRCPLAPALDLFAMGLALDAITQATVTIVVPSVAVAATTQEKR